MIIANLVSSKTIGKIKNILFISHLTNSNNIGDHDSYFGNKYFRKKK